MNSEEVLEELLNVELQINEVQAEINVLLERQDNLYQRKSELQSLLELCKETEDSVSQGTGTSTNSENWSGSFKWDSEADDIKLNIFGISSYRANQREVMGLAALGISASMLTSATSKEDEKFIYKNLEKGEGSMKILYVTPEKISKSKRFMSKLEKCYHAGRLSLIAIDEAHCCSQWGHDFRPDYKNLGILKTQFPNAPVIALTATATQRVQNDLVEMLRIPKYVKFVSTVNRPNLFYMVREKSSVSKVVIDQIAEFIQESYPNNESGIIYCFSRKECEQTCRLRRSYV